jgi:hypothetical protein
MMSRRQLLAERWRRVGEQLHARSPAAFEKAFEMFASLVLENQKDDAEFDDERSLDIDFIYRIC